MTFNRLVRVAGAAGQVSLEAAPGPGAASARRSIRRTAHQLAGMLLAFLGPADNERVSLALLIPTCRIIGQSNSLLTYQNATDLTLDDGEGEMRNLLAVSAIAMSWCLSAGAQSVEKGQSICYEVQNAVNGLVNYTETSCFPTRGKARALSFIIISSEPVFSAEASKKAWVLVTVASIGKSLNEQPSIRADELWLSDANQIRNRIAYVLPAALAKSLQRQIYSGTIDLEGMYAAIIGQMVRKNVSR